MEQAESEFVREIRINEATVSLRKDGIVQVSFNANVTLDVPLQMLLLNIYIKVTEGKKHPFIFEALSGVKVTKEARDNAIEIENQAPGYAYAVVASSLAYQMIANFYLKVKKPSHPYKVFSKKDDAITWLKSVKPE